MGNSNVISGVPVQTDQSSTKVCQSDRPVPAGDYHIIEVSNVDASTSGYTPRGTPPLPTTFTVGDKDICPGATCACEGSHCWCDATDSTGGSGSTGPTTTQSLNAAAAQSKEEADRAAVQIAAADAGIKAAQEAPA